MDAPDFDRIVAGRYEVVEDLGSGGQGNVHRAIDLRDGSTVALKVLAIPNDAATESRFRREATAAQSIDHPNCVRVLDFGEDQPARLLYMAMEIVDGESLDAFLERSGGHLEIEHAIDIIIDVLSALEAAHHASVIHRDLKPRNILLAGDSVKVCDFGSAKFLSRHMTQLTKPGAVIGTGQYMAPEQARGQECDERADLYAAGAILYELITGKPVTRASDRADDDRLDEIFARSLADDRELRYPNAAEMIAALREAVGTTVIAERPKARRRKAPFVAAAFAGVGAIGAVGFVFGPEEAQPRPPEVCAVAEVTGEAELIADRPVDVYLDGELLGRTPIGPRAFAVGTLELEVVDPVSARRKKMRVYVEPNQRRVVELTPFDPPRRRRRK
jgi:eukaryotic-like serine/threonine-protein kinase